MAQYKKIPNGINQLFSGVIINKIIGEGQMGRVIPIMFSPDSLSDTMSLTANQTTIPGGAFPIVTYGSTGARQVSLSLTIPNDYLPPGSSYNTTEEYLQAFRALLYPEYNATSVITPNCSLSLPNLFIDGICTNCNIDYKTDRYVNNGALAAQVSITIMEVKNAQKVVGAITYAKDAVKMSSYGGSGYYYTEDNTNYYDYSVNPNSNAEVALTLYGDNALTYLVQFKKVNNQYVPDYVDPGYNINNHNYSVVILYGCSVDPVEFSPTEIVFNNGSYYVNKNGVIIYFNRGVMRALDEEPTVSMTYYYVYVPYLNNSEYLWNRAKMRMLFVARR